MSTKPAKTYREQVAILKDNHQLIVEDEAAAVNALQSVNYYHYRGYYIHWMDETQTAFKPGVTFGMIQRLQSFDQLLRVVLIAMLQRIELASRTHIGYYIAHRYGPMGHLQPQNFKSPERARLFIDKLNMAIKDSPEVFIRHFKTDCDGEVPIWAAVELLPFGNLSMLFSNMQSADQKQIAKTYYGIDGQLLNSYLYAFSNLRNVCAHCGRVYNKRLSVNVMISRKNEAIVEQYKGKNFQVYPNTLFAVLLAAKDVVEREQWDECMSAVERLLQNYRDVVDPIRLGMPYRWKEILRMP